MPRDLFVEALLDLERCRAAMATELERIEPLIKNVIAKRLEGAPAIEVARATGVPEVRERFLSALGNLSESFANCRAHTIKLLVEEGSMKFSEIAALSGRKRQLISRMYRQAKDPAERGSQPIE